MPTALSSKATRIRRFDTQAAARLAVDGRIRLRAAEVRPRHDRTEAVEPGGGLMGQAGSHCAG
jgi:hypothetical protein